MPNNSLPLYSTYNMTNEDGIRPIMQIDEISQIRGTGKYNPSPYNPLNTNYVSEKTYNRDLHKLNIHTSAYNEQIEPIYINSISSPEIKNSWSNGVAINNREKIDAPLDPFTSAQLNYQKEFGPDITNKSDSFKPDEYQTFALKSIRRSEPLILPYFFSKINVNFIKKSVQEYVQKHRSVNINTEQDTENLLNLMITKYYDAFDSFGLKDCKFEKILGNLNKSVIEDYVKSVFSGIDMHNYYIKDISNLPVPLTRPTNSNIKGVNQLGFVGFFENNHEFTKNIQAFNTRNVVPGPL